MLFSSEDHTRLEAAIQAVAKIHLESVNKPEFQQYQIAALQTQLDPMLKWFREAATIPIGLIPPPVVPDSRSNAEHVLSALNQLTNLQPAQIDSPKSAILGQLKSAWDHFIQLVSKLAPHLAGAMLSAERIALLTSRIKEIASSEQSTKERLEAALKSANEAISTINRQVETTLKEVRESVHLHEAFRHWKRLRTSSCWWAVAFALLGIGIGAAAFGACVAYRMEILRPAADGAIPPTGYFQAGVVAIAILWILRIIARLFLSFTHSFVDARERIVLVQTYLSLLANPNTKNMTESQQDIAFASVFRSSATGLIKEDMSPQTPSMAALKKLMGG